MEQNLVDHLKLRENRVAFQNFLSLIHAEENLQFLIDVLSSPLTLPPKHRSPFRSRQ